VVARSAKSQLGGDPAAGFAAQSPRPEQRQVPETLSRQALRAAAREKAITCHIREYVPGADGEELTHRIALLMARDFAASYRGRTKSWLADECACQAHDVAGRFVFRIGESASRLDMAVNLCRSLVRAAMCADSLDCEEAPL